MKKELLKFLFLVGLALSAPPAYSAYWQWSKTAATNATADSSINWSEGMSPSSVNDSARAMMARAAEQRDDVSGLLATTGTSTAYVVTTNQGLNTPTPTDGQMIAVTVNATNGIAPTLAADGGTAFPIQSSAGVAVPAATLVSGSPYTFKFSAANSAWMLRNFYGSPFSVPLGGVVIFTGVTSPNSNFVFAIGQCISRTTYAAYFALVATTYGACDGTTTFGVPDLRERTVAFQGTMGGASSPGRITTAGSGVNGSTIAASGGLQSSTLTAQANLPSASFTVSGITVSSLAVSGVPVGACNTTFGGCTGGSGVGYEVSSIASNTANLTGVVISSQGTAASGGSSTAFPTLPPVLVLTALVRIF